MLASLCFHLRQKSSSDPRRHRSKGIVGASTAIKCQGEEGQLGGAGVAAHAAGQSGQPTRCPLVFPCPQPLPGRRLQHRRCAHPTPPASCIGSSGALHNIMPLVLSRLHAPYQSCDGSLGGRQPNFPSADPLLPPTDAAAPLAAIYQRWPPGPHRCQSALWHCWFPDSRPWV